MTEQGAPPNSIRLFPWLTHLRFTQRGVRGDGGNPVRAIENNEELPTTTRYLRNGVNSAGVSPWVRPAFKNNFRFRGSRPSLRDEAIAFATLWDMIMAFGLNEPLKECTQTFSQITLILLPANKWVFFSYK
jgi:hypothetical protein